MHERSRDYDLGWFKMFERKDSFEALYSDIKRQYDRKTSNNLIKAIDSVRKGEYRIDFALGRFRRDPGLPEIQQRVENLFLKFKDNEEKDMYGDLFTYPVWVKCPYPTDFDRHPTSGWKLHVYGENAIDSFKIFQILHRGLKKYMIPYKLATKDFHDEHPKGRIQHGKACVIYLPMWLLYRRKDGINFINDIAKILKHNSHSKSGAIKGDRHHEGSVHYRYEMDVPIRPHGFDNKSYKSHYLKSDGKNYNRIMGNYDLFEFIKKTK